MWTKTSLPVGTGRGIRIRVSSDDLLNVGRAEGIRTQQCGGGVAAIYATEVASWQAAKGLFVIDWEALLNIEKEGRLPFY